MAASIKAIVCFCIPINLSSPQDRTEYIFWFGFKDNRVPFYSQLLKTPECFWQREKQGLKLPWQCFPWYPGWHWHRAPPLMFSQVPPCWQGFGQQKSTPVTIFYLLFHQIMQTTLQICKVLALDRLKRTYQNVCFCSSFRWGWLMRFGLFVLLVLQLIFSMILELPFFFLSPHPSLPLSLSLSLLPYPSTLPFLRGGRGVRGSKMKPWASLCWRLRLDLGYPRITLVRYCRHWWRQYQ